MPVFAGSSSRARGAVVLFVVLSISVWVVTNGVAGRSGPAGHGPSAVQPPVAESASGAGPAVVPTALAWNWVQSTPPVAPSARAGAAMVYDVADGYTLLFGGCPSWGGDYWAHNCTAIGDTWALRSDGVWTNLTASLSGPSPPARADAGIAYDSADRVVVMFGGFDGYTVYNDTWTYSANHWTQVHPSLSPSARFSPGMAGDDAAGKVVLFGGLANTSTTNSYNDTWTFAGGVWSRLSTPVAPAPRFSMGMAYDPAGSFVLLFGGWNKSVGSFGDTWDFANGAWTQLSPSFSPPAENYPTMVYDFEAGAMIMTGGHVGYVVSPDTWAYNVSTGWELIPTSASPTPCWGLSLSYDPASMGVWLFGGYYAYGYPGPPVGVYLNDTWEFTLMVVPVGLYAVTFTEVGLPGGTSWSVTLGGSTRNSTTASITFQVGNGSYLYSIATVPGYSVAPTTGTQLISGNEATIGVVFAPSASSSSSTDTFWEGLLAGGVIVGAVVFAVIMLRPARPPTVPPLR